MRYRTFGRARHKDIEFQEQMQLAYWLRGQDILFTTSIAGVNLSKTARGKAKAAGYLPGTPDVMIFEPRGVFKGLFIEMKRPAIPGVCDRGTATPEQLDFHSKARARNYAAVICYDATEAMNVVKIYLEIKNP